MGLTAYGKIIKKWINPINEFITSYTGIRSEFSPLYWEAAIADNVFKLPGFGVVKGKNTFNGPEDINAQNFAATFQYCWSQIVQSMVHDLIKLTGINDVCVVGGCALNATTNYDLLNSKYINRLHFIPHPNDEGISAGAALYTYYSYQNKPWNGLKKTFNPYIGLPIMDINQLKKFAKLRNADFIGHDPYSLLANEISSGKKIAVMNGRAEIGPRALGNRSIICDPRNKEMKDIINNTIKHREWYRPVAPAVRDGDQSKYFKIKSQSPYMSYIALVKNKWKNIIPSVVHQDNTSRVQTVTFESNPFFWNLINEFEKITGVGVLLNTSFNGKGQPIFSKISEALKLLDESDLDAVYIEGYYFKKN
jgi:carbamoyltransferase